MVDLIFKYYEYFYRKISMNPDYHFVPADRDVAHAQKFLERFQSTIGESTLFEYMSFQFYYWHDKDTRFGKGKVMLNWVIGDKAFSRWASNKSDWYSYSTELNRLYGVERSDLIEIDKLDIMRFDTNEVYPYEERDRGLYHNTAEGVVHCSDFTTMYHPKSKWCSSCSNVGLCKTIMRNKYSSIYIKRLEA